jgi:DNA repair photolyase
MERKALPGYGRGTTANPPNRFEKLSYVPDPEWAECEAPAPSTEYLRETPRAIISYNESPDIGFEASVNPYRGCEHGCVYCYARPYHEYLGFSSGLDFETKIVAKEGAPALLERELSSARWKPQVLVMCGVTDAYQPVERHLKLTRGCLEVLAEFRNPVVIITKNHLVTRDIDVLKKLAEHQAAGVFISVTTLDSDLARKMEPRASSPARRLAAIEALARSGIPIGVLIGPVIPGLTDHEIPSIIAAAADAGAGYAGKTVLRLPYAVKHLFVEWLERNFPDRKEKVLSRVRSMRGGKLNDPAFGSRMRGEGIFAEQISALFRAACKKAGLHGRSPELSTAAFRPPEGPQLRLFE